MLYDLIPTYRTIIAKENGFDISYSRGKAKRLRLYHAARSKEKRLRLYHAAGDEA